jgi:hypothetical protein
MVGDAAPHPLCRAINEHSTGVAGAHYGSSKVSEKSARHETMAGGCVGGEARANTLARGVGHMLE